MIALLKRWYWNFRRVYFAIVRAWRAGSTGALTAQWEERTADRVLPTDHFETLIYFADGTVNLYQLRQWYEPFKALDAEAPAIIVCRSASAALALLDESPLPVFYGARIEAIENLVNEQRFKTALYVNQNTRNFQMMRYATMLHVFISHGESDKSYMISGQMKCYDFAFIAGDAAANRLSGAILGYDVPSRTKRIGRPQLDAPVDGGPDLPDDERSVVFYAPTWEGDRPSMSYGSLASHGVAMVTALIATRRHRVIFRAHPRTGVVSEEHVAAKDQIEELLRHANREDPSAGHFIDETPSFDWQLSKSDACITDVSAAAIDWLATGKPIVVTRPASESAALPTEGFLSDVDLLAPEEASTIVAALEASNNPELELSRARWTEYYFGDTTPGAPTEAWLAACREVREYRDHLQEGMSELEGQHGDLVTQPHREASELEEMEFDS